VIEDLRHAGRVFAKHPGYLLTAMLTLALGIGFTTATFSVLNAVLLRPLPYADAGRLVHLNERVQPRPTEFSVSPAHYLFWREHNTAFAGVAAWAPQSVNLDTGSGGPERVGADRVTGNMFAVLGVEAAAGRTFTDADDREEAPLVALLSHGSWQRRFGGRADAIGRTVFFDRKPATIVGVMPRGFVLESADNEMWVPMRLTGRDRLNYSSHYMTAVARLKPGVTLARADADMQAVSRRLGEINPGSKGWDVRIVRLRDYLVQDVETTLYVLFGAVSLVLLIACANVANLVLVRGAARHKELAIRSAIGASRRRLLRQLMVEQRALAALSAAAGVLMAAWLLRSMVTILPDALPLQQGIAIDARVLAFALALAALTPLLFGLLPALQGSRPNLRALLSAGGRSGTSVPARRMRAAIVIGEIALATMLLVGAGLLVRSFARLLAVSPGFLPARTILAGVSLPLDKYPEGEARARFLSTFLERTRGLPRVAAAGVTTAMPMVSDASTGLEIEGQPIPAEGKPLALFYGVSPGYFEAMGIPLLQGRLLTESDRLGATGVVVINQTIADRYFQGQDPIGHRIRTAQGGSGWHEIIGVAGNVKQRGLAERDAPQVYESFLQHPAYASFSLVVRTRDDDPAAVTPELRAILRTMDPSLPLARVQTLQSVVDAAVRPQRFSTTLIGLFGAAALLLAAVGIYSVMAYSVGLRTQEFAVRIAHGARRSDILRLVLRGALTMSAAGIGGGLVAAWLMRRVVATMLFGVTGADTGTYAGVAVVLALAAVTVSGIPALRATRVDPLTALRGD
jgi:putative ABC transport system permease protein